MRYTGKTAELFDHTLGLFRDYEREARFIRSQLARSRSNGRRLRVLDLGCGTGVLLEQLARASGNDVVLIGVDMSSDMINVARRRCKGLPVMFTNDEAINYLKCTQKRFDCILCLFNFVQGFQSSKALICFLEQVSRHLTPNGIAVFDWHNEPVFRRRHPPLVATLLNLPLRGPNGTATCRIHSKYSGSRKTIRCDFRVRQCGRPIIRHRTRHSLRILTHQSLEEMLERGYLKEVHTVASFDGAPFLPKQSERGVTVARAMRFSEQIETVAHSRLRDHGMRPAFIGVVGSSAFATSKPREGDVDVVLVVRTSDLSRRGRLASVKMALRDVCHTCHLDSLELRHGPFKLKHKLQLHALLHTDSSIDDIPAITRWVWHLTRCGEHGASALFPRRPSRMTLINSCKQEVLRLRRQFESNTFQYRRWECLPQPVLRTHETTADSKEKRQMAFRYFVLAAASDVAAIWDAPLKNLPWLRSKFSRRFCSILIGTLSGNRIRGEDVGIALAELSEFLSHQSSGRRRR